MTVAIVININAIMKSSILIGRCFENKLATQAKAMPKKRATFKSIVVFSKKTGIITHSAIMVNTALTDKQRILSNGILNVFFILIIQLYLIKFLFQPFTKPAQGQNKDKRRTS